MVERKSLVEILQQRASEQPELEAYTFLQDGDDESASLSFPQLDLQARAVAAFLDEEIAAAGARVLLLYPPGLDFLAAFFGCLYCRAIAVPAYPPRSKRGLPRLVAIARDAQPALGSRRVGGNRDGAAV